VDPEGSASGPGWVARQPPDHYTIQLLGARDRDAGEAFIARHGLGDQARVVTSQYRGRPWQVVIHGSYPSRAAAVEAMERLPADLRRGGPWPRTFASLQD
jgi:DamX protein